MKFLSLLASLLLLVSSSSCMGQAEPNSLTEKEKEEGWKLLFDGTSTDHWRGYNKKNFPDKGWKVEGQSLKVLAKGSGGDIITEEKYGDFILKLEWKVAKGGNSGIFYRAMEQPTQPIYWSAPEMQLLDNVNHPDAQKGSNGNHKAGSLYDLIPAQPQNANSYGEWNTARIVADGATIQHWQNGENVVEYELWTNDWYKMIRDSKFLKHPEFGDAREGYIGLQDHGNTVSFRNIKIKKL